MSDTPSSSELVIRRYRPDDGDAVRALHERALDLADSDVGRGDWDDDLSAIEDVYLSGGDEGGEFLVGTIGGELVVMGALRRTGPRDAKLTRMRVEPRLQGRGLGTEMLDALEDRARALGLTRLRLDTTTRQHAAQALFRGHGFHMTGTGREGPFEVIFFEKELEPGPQRGA